MIRNLPKSLVEYVTNFLQNSKLFEEAYERKRAMELIPSHATQLAQKLVMLHHMPVDCSHKSHWEQTTNTHIKNIVNLTRLKGNKRLQSNDIDKTVFDEPIGEYEDYLFHHKNVVSEKSDIKFSEPSQNDYTQIKNKYSKLISNINAGEVPKVRDIE
jgi:hypothetical protein